MRRLLLALTLVMPPLLLEVAVAEPIYRCESGEQVVYQDLPCPGEGVRVPLAVPQPSPEEVGRIRERREQMRDFNREATEARQAAEAARAEREAAEREAARDRALDALLAREQQRQGRDEADERSERVLLFPVRPLGVIGRHHRGTTVCPLGLSNCKKVGGHRHGPPLRHPEHDHPRKPSAADDAGKPGRTDGLRD